MKCLELAEQLEDQGYSEKDVEEKVDTYRKQLLNKEVKLRDKTRPFFFFLCFICFI